MVARILCLILVLLAPAVLRAQRERLSPADLAWVEENFPHAIKTNTGLRYVVLEEGAGETAKRGDLVSVLYVGRLIGGQTFDQTNDKDHPFQFRVGRSQVIRGWDYILQLMRPGDKWMVIVPSDLAYGTRGRPPHIPRNATLIFMIQLLKVERP